jgi:hypothetical protein
LVQKPKLRQIQHQLKETISRCTHHQEGVFKLELCPWDKMAYVERMATITLNRKEEAFMTVAAFTRHQRKKQKTSPY